MDDSWDPRDPRPRPLGDETTHFWLIQRMAKATDVDLVAASAKGHLTQNTWAEMVGACRGCMWADGCQRWLNTPVEDVRAVPDRCVNADKMARIRAALPPA